MASSTETTDSSGDCHLIVLVHGWLGNDKEMGYIAEAIQREASTAAAAAAAAAGSFVVHSVVANLRKTTDGIAAGAERVAQETIALIEQHQATTLSFVGNSLGGLYARYALFFLSECRVKPLVFCTTATPHLGVSKHTYLPIPRWLERMIGSVLQTTGADLFGLTPVLDDLHTQPAFLAPLRRFSKRIAYGNAFGTDFQVPVTTALFLSKTSNYPHKQISTRHDKQVLLRLETVKDAQHDTSRDYATVLDAMGWTKVFCDVREGIPLPSLPLPFVRACYLPRDRREWTSRELIPFVTRFGNKWKIPLGHTVMVANTKSPMEARMNVAGRPIMDQLAKELVHDIASMTKQQD